MGIAALDRQSVKGESAKNRQQSEAAHSPFLAASSLSGHRFSAGKQEESMEFEEISSKKEFLGKKKQLENTD